MKRFSYKKNELNHLDAICKKIIDKDFAERVDFYLRWYIYKARRAKFYYYFFNCTTIILPLIVSFINGFYCQKNNYVIEILSLILPISVSLFASLSVLFRFLEKWNNYRSTATQINIFLDKYIDYQNMKNFDEQKNLNYIESFQKLLMKNMVTGKKHKIKEKKSSSCIFEKLKYNLNYLVILKNDMSSQNIVSIDDFIAFFIRLECISLQILFYAYYFIMQFFFESFFIRV